MNKCATSANDFLPIPHVNGLCALVANDHVIGMVRTSTTSRRLSRRTDGRDVIRRVVVHCWKGAHEWENER
jgi:hypothetical protein